MAKKVLEATLVSPTAHKERKLTSVLGAYRDALHTGLAVFERSPDILDDVLPHSELADSVVEGLDEFIRSPASDDVGLEEVDDHPMSLLDPAVTLDRDGDREHEFCWEVPADDPFWVPLSINPLQQDLWASVATGEAEPQKLTLQEYTRNWVLELVVRTPESNATTGPTEPSSAQYDQYWLTDDPERTPIGVDIGETALVAGCALDGGKPVDPVLVDGRKAKHLRKEMFTTLNRLDQRDAAEWRVNERFETFRNRLIDIIEKASRELVEYARRFDDPVLVMEDLDVGGENLSEAKFEHRRLNMWSFNHLQKRIAEKANNADIPIAFVDPEYTSQTCHACRHIGERDGSFECLNDDCWVTTYQSDINAAATIALRYNPWGESCSLKSSGDDSPRDGSPRDGATEHRERGDNLEHNSRTHGSKTQPAGHWSPAQGTLGK